MGRFSALARANASGPHGYQSTGLWAWRSRYGLVSRASQLVCFGAAWPSGPGPDQAGQANPIRAPIQAPARAELNSRRRMALPSARVRRPGADGPDRELAG